MLPYTVTNESNLGLDLCSRKKRKALVLSKGIQCLLMRNVHKWCIPGAVNSDWPQSVSRNATLAHDSSREFTNSLANEDFPVCLLPTIAIVSGCFEFEAVHATISIAACLHASGISWAGCAAAADRYSGCWTSSEKDATLSPCILSTYVAESSLTACEAGSRSVLIESAKELHPAARAACLALWIAQDLG